RLGEPKLSHRQEAARRCPMAQELPARGKAFSSRYFCHIAMKWSGPQLEIHCRKFSGNGEACGANSGQSRRGSFGAFQPSAWLTCEMDYCPEYSGQCISDGVKRSGRCLWRRSGLPLWCFIVCSKRPFPKNKTLASSKGFARRCKSISTS